VVTHNKRFDRGALLALVMLRDDTEEDLVGSDLHQTAIRALYEGLWLAGRKDELPWHVSTQLMVLMGRVGGKEWHPSPDVFVHPTAGPEPRVSFDVRVEGVPPFVAEVVSEATWGYDVEGKRFGYDYVGVREYIAFDPTTELLGASVRAWRAADEGFEEWLPGADGRWHSRVLAVAFQPDGPLLRVFDRNGAPLPTFDEQALQREGQARRVVELESELRRLRGT